MGTSLVGTTLITYTAFVKLNNISADAAMHESVGAIAATGVSPIVRIPDNQGWLVKREWN